EAADGRYVKIALTIAGSDSGGGAGIQADLKTFHQFGVFGTSVITAVTAQNTVGVLAWEPVSAALVTRQLDALAMDLPPGAVKSGMLASAVLVETVATGIARHRLHAVGGRGGGPGARPPAGAGGRRRARLRAPRHGRRTGTGRRTRTRAAQSLRAGPAASTDGRALGSVEMMRRAQTGCVSTR